LDCANIPDHERAEIDIQVHLPTPSQSVETETISTSPFLQQPSAIFIPIDADARRIWLVRPNISSLGKVLLDA